MLGAQIRKCIKLAIQAEEVLSTDFSGQIHKYIFHVANQKCRFMMFHDTLSKTTCFLWKRRAVRILYYNPCEYKVMQPYSKPTRTSKYSYSG